MGIYTTEAFTNGTKMQNIDADFADDPGPNPGGSSSPPVQGLGALSTGFLGSTSAHGLPKIISSKSLWRKLSWLVIFLGASVIFTQMMWISFETYFSRPVEINIQYLVRTDAEFPAVTVCNLNPLKRSLLEGTDYASLKTIDETYGLLLEPSGRGRGDEKSVESQESGPTNSARNSEISAALNKQVSGDASFELKNSRFMSNAVSDTDFVSFMSVSQTDDYSDLTDLLKPGKDDLDRLGHKASDLIVQCSFDKTNCTYLDFTKVYNSRYGNCYVFNLPNANGTGVRTTSMYGSRYGLRLTLNIESQDYIGLYSHETGARVAVHPANVTAFPEDEGINAPTDTSTAIGIKTSSFTRLPSPYKSDCADGSNNTLLTEGEYTVWSCMLTCVQDNLRRECGCLDMAGLSQNETRCSLINATQEVCRQKIYTKYNQGDLGCYCPLPCQEVHYDTKVSSSTWPSDNYIPLLWSKLGSNLQSLGYDNIRDANWPSDNYIPILWNKIGDNLRNLGFTSIGQSIDTLVRIHVYLEDFTIHNTEELKAFTEEDLLAAMGGYLGLFIGVSACTVMEFLEYLLDMIFYMVAACGGCCKGRQLKKQKAKNKTMVEHVKIPVDNTKIGTTKTKLMRMESINESDKVGLGFVTSEYNPKFPTRW